MKTYKKSDRKHMKTYENIWKCIERNSGKHTKTYKKSDRKHMK